jgi:hypothetical protein
MKQEILEPIHEEDSKWYFWNETFTKKIGPFHSKEEAEKNLVKYCFSLEACYENKSQ